MLCFRKFPVAKKFMDRRGEYQDFRLNVFSLTVPKKFLEEPLCVPQNLCHRNISRIEEGGVEAGSITIFCQKILSHNAQNFCRGTR